MMLLSIGRFPKRAQMRHCFCIVSAAEGFFALPTECMTEANKKEEEGNERFRTIIQNIPDYAIFMIDPEGIITEWTKGAEIVKGYTAAEAIGQHLSIFYTPQDRAVGAVDQELQQAASEGRTERENWRVRKGGTWFWGNEICSAI
jgi:PAS domain S-box-containing protein